jgi:hypothetical protein
MNHIFNVNYINIKSFKLIEHVGLFT